MPTESVTGSAIRYTYDAFNRLTQYETDDVLALYSYNAEDYRVGKTIFDDSGAKNVLYFYEGSRVIMETDEAGNITAHNLYGTNLISRSVQGEGYYYLYNAHGDVVMLMDTATGAIAATYRYDAFGNVIARTGNPDNSITYAGYQYDEESGLYYLNARYYDSSTARFLTEDTYRGRQQDPLSLHRYTYCHNNPIVYVDPTGHNIWDTLKNGYTVVRDKLNSIGKSVDVAVNNAVDGALTTVSDAFLLFYYSAALDVGGIMHLTGAMDDQTWEFYQDIAYDKLDPYYEKPNVFKPIGDWLSYGAGSIYMMATGQDQQTIHNFQQIAEGQFATHLGESAESIVMLKDSFATAFNPRNMYNFYLNPETSQEEMNKLAADGLTVGLILAPAVKGLSGMKISAKSTPAYVINGNGTLAVSNSYSLAISTEGVAVNSAYYAAAAVGAVGGSNGGGSASGGYQSGRKSPNGLIGHDFEDYLTKNVGGEGSFSVGGRDFDGGIGNRWWEAKSGQYWDMLERNSRMLERFKTDMGDRLKIATDNGASYELFSNTPIPSSIKQWLDKKGIPYTELLD